MIRSLILMCFFMSGACSLIYEVAWIRLLSLVFGNTVFALSAVLTSFMGGLAMGSLFFGKFCDKLIRNSGSSGDSNLLKLYAFLEAGIGVYCFFTPLIFKGIEAIYIKAYQGLSFYPFTILRFLLCMSVLLIPTFFMGATLPILSKYFIKNYQRLGKGVGDLYAINTFGAVLGVIFAGYLLPTLVGIKMTIYMTAVTNMGIALLILLLAKLSTHRSRLPAHSLPATSTSLWPVGASAQGGERWHSIAILVAFGLAGLASMIYEVGWARVLALILGSSTYAFTTMLVTFLAGIALGSFLFARLWGKRRVSLAMLGAIELGIGLTAFAMMPILGKLPYYLLELSPTFGNSFTGIISLQFIFCFMVMLIPTLLMGAAFPIASRLYTKNLPGLGGSIGRVYGANTFGCILGSFMAGFILIPFTGVQATLWLAILINSFIGITLLILDQKRAFFKLCYGCLFTIPLTGIFWVPGWDKAIMTSGISVYASCRHNEQLGERIHNKNLLYYKDGANCTVSVVREVIETRRIPYLSSDHHDRVNSGHEHSEALYLKVNGKTDASNVKGDMVNQLLLGYLPVLLHPDPQNAFVLGLGSGITVGALAQYPLREIDCVEIEQAVVEAARYFNNYNHNVLKDPRLNLIIADGRNYLLATRKRYDIIVSEPSNPWIAGISSLFTREHYELCKSRLNRDGIMVQWAHTYSMSEQDFKMIINTFRSVFPHCQVWFSTKDDILLIGKHNEIKIDYQILSERMARFPQIRADLKNLSLNLPPSIFSCYLLGEEDVQKFTAFSKLNTDDLPLLEFSAPRNLYTLKREENFKGILRYKTSPLPPLINFEPDEFQKSDFYCNLGICCFDRGLTGEALKNFLRAVRIEPQNSLSHMYLGRIYLSQGVYLKALKEFNTSINLNPGEAYAYYYRGKTYHRQELFHEALKDFQRALKILPDEYRFKKAKSLAQEKYKNYLAWLQLEPEGPQEADFYYKRGVSYFQKGLIKEALREFLRAKRLDPQNPSVHMDLGKIYHSQRLYLKAMGELNTTVALDPEEAYAYYYRGRISYGQEFFHEALIDFQKAMEISPHEHLFKIANACVLMDMKKYGLAVVQLEQALNKDLSKDSLFWDRLGMCYYHLGQYPKAAKAIRTALEISPRSYEIRRHLADVYLSQSNYPEAIDMYQSVVELNPNLLSAHVNLGVCYYHQGNYAEARTHLQKVLERDPYNQRAIEVVMQLER
ncbi:MAG: fused MFS/spermidine synthase [Proteobacteria bacterium]|nr:fused MFS/spermidine synthase [Pseudomonadota bacterium]